MKVSREQAERNREHVIDTAAQLMRSHGYDGIGVADLMKAAGLTHGGFYRNFASKEDLTVQATRKAFVDTRHGIEAITVAAPEAPFSALVSRYVSAAHRDNLEVACGLTALATDAARRKDPELRAVFAEAIEDYLAKLNELAPGMPPSAHGRPPEAILAEMVGAVILSRVMAHSTLSDKLLAAVTADLLGQD